MTGTGVTVKNFTRTQFAQAGIDNPQFFQGKEVRVGLQGETYTGRLRVGRHGHIVFHAYPGQEYFGRKRFTIFDKKMNNYIAHVLDRVGVVERRG